MSDKSNGHVFISYSYADKLFVDMLSEQLRTRGISVWSGQEDLKFVSDLQEVITHAIRDASVIIVVVSENSVGSSWQNIEMGIAISLALPVIPIRLMRDGRSPELPSFLRRWRSIESDESNVVEVVDLVAKAIKN